MLREFLKDFVDLARTRKIERLTAFDTDAEFVLMQAETGQIFREKRPRPPRNHAASTIGSLVSVLQAHSGDSPCVYLKNGQAVGIFQDDNDSLDRVGLSFAESQLFSHCDNLVNKSPKDLLDRLRFDMFAASKLPVDLIQKLSKLKFSDSTETETDHGHADDAVSKRVKSSVTGEGDIPLECTFSFAPYPTLAAELPDLQVDILCAIRCNASKGTVSIMPYPDQLVKARQVALQAVSEKIAELHPTLPVYFGTHSTEY